MRKQFSGGEDGPPPFPSLNSTAPVLFSSFGPFFPLLEVKLIWQSQTTRPPLDQDFFNRLLSGTVSNLSFALPFDEREHSALTQGALFF